MPSIIHGIWQPRVTYCFEVLTFPLVLFCIQSAICEIQYSYVFWIHILQQGNKITSAADVQYFLCAYNHLTSELVLIPFQYLQC